MKTSLIIIVAVALLYIPNTTESYVFAMERVEVKDEVLEYFLDELAMCESSNNESVYRVEDNGDISHGAYQYSLPTMKHFLYIFGMEQQLLEDAEIINLFYGYEFAREMTRRVLVDTGEWWRWSTCSQKTGIDYYIKNK